MAPIVAFGTMPPTQPSRQHRSVYTRSKLLKMRKQGFAIEQERYRLDQADRWVFLHRGSQSHDRVAAHETIGIEHDHEIVMAAKSPHPLGDVTGLSRGILLAMAIVHTLTKG